MSYLLSIIEKIVFVILLMGTGILAKKMKWISEEGEKDLSRLMVDFVWPSLIFSSVTRNLSAADILTNIWLPVLSVFVHLTGYAVGLVICRLAGFKEDRRKIFLFHATMNNFFVMALPFAEFFLPEKGAALLAVANLGSVIMLWSLGATVVAGSLGVKETVKGIFSPGMVATLGAVLFVITGMNRYIPSLVSDSLVIIGQPTLLFGLMIAGTQIYKLGKNALKFDLWNILVGCTRNILVPALLFGVTLPVRNVLPREALIIFMLVAITPASVNSVTVAMKYKTAPHLAAEGVIFTHLLSMGSMLGFVVLIDRFLA